MYLSILLCGAYLGGVLVILVNRYFRSDDPCKVESVFYAFGWPLGLVVLSVLGRQQSRDALGILTVEEIDDLERQVDDLLNLLEQSRRDTRAAIEDFERQTDNLLRMLGQSRRDTLVEVSEAIERASTAEEVRATIARLGQD